MRSTLFYTAARLAIFAAALGLFYLAGARGLLLLVLAAVVSAAASYIALSRPREQMAGSIARRVSGFRERLDEGSRAEDEDAGEPSEPSGPVRR